MLKTYLKLFILQLFICIQAGITPSSLIAQKDTNQFVMTWRTSNPGLSDSNSIVIVTDQNHDYNFDIDWNNDGSFDDLGVTETITHQYDKSGDYTIRIRGLYPKVAFRNQIYFPLGDRLKLIAIDQWGNNVWRDMSYAFNHCHNLRVDALDAPDLSMTTDISYMFANTSSLTGEYLDYWDVSSVVNMEGLFLNASSFNGDISYWNVSSVQNMESMFNGATSFNQEIGRWNISSINNMNYMFMNAISFDGNISVWDVSMVSDMSCMFYGTSSFSHNLSYWSFSSGINPNRLFQRPTGFLNFLNAIDVLLYTLSFF